MNKNLIYLVAALVILAGLLVIFKPAEKVVPANSSKTEVKTYELEVKNKKLVSGPEKITVTEGEKIIIKITVDEDEEFHLHGYDQSIDVQKNKQAELKVTAKITGSFAFELENSKTDISSLEVNPK